MHLVNFKNMAVVGVILSGLLFISGCSTWTAEKCQNTNWDSQGYSDGAEGKNSTIGSYAGQCQKKGVNVNSKAYDTGYQRGLLSFCNYNKGHQTALGGEHKLAICSPIAPYNQGYAQGTKEYCTETQGYKVALDGGPEAQICSGNAAAAFSKGYKKGRKKFVLEEIANIKEDLTKAATDLDEVRDKLSDKQAQLARIPQQSYEPEVIRLRQELQDEVAHLTNTRNEIKGEIDKMKASLSQLEKEARTK